MVINRMIARKSLLLALSRYVSLGFGFVSLYFITNYIPNTEADPIYGTVTLAISNIGLFAFLTDLGFGTTHIRKVSSGMDEGRCNGTYLTIKAVFLMTYVAIILTYIFGWEAVFIPVQNDICAAAGLDPFFSPFESDYFMKLLLIFLVWGILSNITTIATATMIAKQEVAKNTLMTVVGGLVQAIVTIVVVLMTDDIYIFAGTWVLGAAVTAGIGAFYILRYPIKLPTKEYLKDYALFAAPLAFAASMNPIQQNIDKVMIGSFQTNDQVGWYAVAQRFSNVPLLLIIPISTLFLPAQTQLAAKKNKKAFREFIYNTERYVTMMVLPMTVLVAAVALPFITILTDIQYTESAPILAILMLNIVLVALSKPYETMFISQGKPKYLLFMKLAFFPLNIILNLMLIPSPEQFFGLPVAGLGPTGAALATLLTFSISYVVKRILSYRLTPMGISFSIMRQLLAISIAAITLYLCNEMVWGIDRIYELVLYGVAGIAIYWAVLVLTKEFTWKEFNMIMDTLNVQKMWEYVKHEVRDRRH